MAHIVFYHQERFDGATRTGLECDGQTWFEHFQPGSEEADPVLLWYVDVSLMNDQCLPSPEMHDSLWASIERPIRLALETIAERTQAGIDFGDSTAGYQEAIHDEANGYQTTVKLFALRRLTSREISRRLQSLIQQDHWRTLLNQLMTRRPAA
jgi:hypothetical protein